ncbi:MAG: hypothetical protein C0405_11945, partial [Desulfovibrio sp.]|nr:hypothetical protein [Desulfovibrio sp.]
MPKPRNVFFLVVLFLVALMALALVILWPHLEGRDPEIALDRPLTHIGRATPLAVSVKDADSGLSTVKITLVQGNKEHVLHDKNYATVSTWTNKGQERAEIKLEIKA